MLKGGENGGQEAQTDINCKKKERPLHCILYSRLFWAGSNAFSLLYQLLDYSLNGGILVAQFFKDV